MRRAAGSRAGTTPCSRGRRCRRSSRSRRRARPRTGSTRAGPTAGRAGRPGSPAPRIELEHDVEDDEVQQRVHQRPREPERAVLVLDLQLLADHRRRGARGSARCRAIRSRDTDARTDNARSPATQWPPSATVVQSPRDSNQVRQRTREAGADRPVVRTARRRAPRRQHLDVLVHEDVVDLAVRPVRGIRAAEHRALPTREQRTTAGPQKLKSPAMTAGRSGGGQLRANVAHVRDGPAYQSFDDACEPDDVDVDVADATRARERVAYVRHGHGTRRPSAARASRAREAAADRELPRAGGSHVAGPPRPSRRARRSASCAPSSPRRCERVEHAVAVVEAKASGTTTTSASNPRTTAATSNRRARVGTGSADCPSAR